MSAKMGRPLKSDKPLNVEVKIRIDEDTNQRLLDYAERNNLAKTEVIRKGIELILEQ
ncbi:TPA: CopG family transcriptional regulator [Streptococcus suis]|uniref:CopG family transcriptional regulator n=1 Tax=Streptococcus suis TaxID=1307 RepID=UPI000DC772B7|nr:CopG family transcriptional regulator [Streptococcus suis]AWX97001.1 CopG family transcriptional regulator [Streptococcus suis]HEL1649727.1 CopG family transcriptional regulator [Streptococcus suis]